MFAGMMELADVLDSKSSGSDTVSVRPRLPAPTKKADRYSGLLQITDKAYLKREIGFVSDLTSLYTREAFL